MNEDGRDSETLSGSQAPTIPGSPPSGLSSPPVTVFRPSLPVGEKFGSYLLLRALGKGGMGEVYEAEHEETRRRVALKVLSRGLEGPTDRARFLREGRLAASVSHPNNVYVYGTEEIEGTAVITMELVPGGTLKDRVERQGPMRLADAVDAILQVIDGLEAAAAKGMLHRDVKPSNCFVDRDGTVKIGDFGLSMSTLSRAESHLTATGTFLGTPAFASPEQVRCDEVDIRSDIYSVSATLYYLVTGRAPFEGERMGKLLSSVLERLPEPPRRFRHDLPAGLERVIQRGLQKKPSARSSDYAALRSELAPFGSAAPWAATLTLRVGASVLDTLLLGLPEFFAGGLAGMQAGMQGRKFQPVPLYARSWIEGLARGTESDPEAVVASLKVTLELPSSVSVGKRVCHLLLCGLLALGFGVAIHPAMSPAGTFGSIAAVALISAFLFRGGLLLRLLGISVVTKDGLSISRLRASFRSVAGWSPSWIVALACLIAGLAGFTLDVVIIIPVLLAYFLLELVPVRNTEIDPGRGFQDRIAGTWLVPRWHLTPACAGGSPRGTS